MDNIESKSSDKSQEKAIKPEERPETTPRVSDSKIPPTGKRGVFNDLRRQLSEEDLKSPGVQKLILHMLEDADARCDDLKETEREYHRVDKQAGILQEKLKTNLSVEVIYSFTLSVGSVLLGFGIQQGKSGWPESVLGGIFIVGAIIARAVKR